MQLAVLQPKAMELGPHGGVIVPMLQRGDDGRVGERRRLDHGKAAEGVAQRVPEGEEIVVVVGHQAAKALPGTQHLVVHLGVVAVEAVDLAAVVVNFHGEQPAQVFVIIQGLQRPIGVVVAAKKAKPVHALNEGVDIFAVVALFSEDVRLFFRGLGLRVGIIKIEVVGAAVVIIARLHGRVDVDLIGCQRQKAFVAELGMPGIAVMVRIGDDGVALSAVGLLQLLQCQPAV